MVWDFDVNIFGPCVSCGEVWECPGVTGEFTGEYICSDVADFLASHPKYEQNHSFFVSGSAPTYSAAAAIVFAFLRSMSLAGYGYEGYTVRIRPHE